MINNGPDRIPRAVITIDWPYETASGKHLLYLMDVQVYNALLKNAQNVLQECNIPILSDVVEGRDVPRQLSLVGVVAKN